MPRGYSEIRPELAAASAGRVGVASDAAQSIIVDAVRAGDFVPLSFVDVTALHPSVPGISATFRIAPKALRIGVDGDSLAVPLTHESTQAIADLLDLRVPTANLLDRVVERFGVPVEPFPTLDTAKMAALPVVEQHSADLEHAAGPYDNTKAWITHQRLWKPETLINGKQSGINYLWATKAAAVPQGQSGPKPAESSTAFRVLQQPGAVHSYKHSDRSQMGIGFVDPAVLVSSPAGELGMSIDELARDPVLFPLVSNVPLPEMRHPWLAPCLSLQDGGSCPLANPPPPAVAAASSTRSARVATVGAALLAAALLWYLWRTNHV